MEKARLSRMNGYGSHPKLNAAALVAIHRTTSTVWPMMKRGVPKKRAKRSAATPKRSLPNAP